MSCTNLVSRNGSAALTADFSGCFGVNPAGSLEPGRLTDRIDWEAWGRFLREIPEEEWRLES